MSCVVPRRLGMTAFALAVCPTLALAEAGPAARAWTDPPAREAAGAPAEAARPPEVAAAPASVAPATQAANQAAKRPGKAASARVVPRPRVASPIAVPRRQVVGRAPRQGFAAAQRRPAARVPAIRVVTLRPFRSMEAPPERYGDGMVPARFPFEGDARALQIREAEAAGYRVVRSRPAAFPGGRHPRAYPFLEEDADD